MRFAHLADLHLGRKVNSYSMIENQRSVLKQVVEKAVKREVDAVILAGDIYDSQVPEADAMEVLNEFLCALKDEDIDVFMIAGNHDRGDLINYGGALLEEMNIHVCGTWTGKMECIDMLDKYGPLHVWCLPYITPSVVNRLKAEGEPECETFTDAVAYALSKANLDMNERNVLIAHQYFDGAVVPAGGSEDYLSLGSEIVDVSVLAGFDYVALGHVHTAQSVGIDTVRYSGAPLIYSTAEIGAERSFTLVNLEDKGTYRISTIELTPEREMKNLIGTFRELLNPEMIAAYKDMYVNIILKETKDIPDVIRVLKDKYPYVMGVAYADGRIRLEGTTEVHTEVRDGVLTAIRQLKLKEPNALFADFYEFRNKEPMNEEQKQYMAELIENTFGGTE
jgi:exonuclease SbcD